MHEVRPMVTQRHIAQLAGVDRSTVSCALRGTGSIRPEIRDKILGITQRLGYIPNANATALRTAASNLIGVVSAPLDSPYHALLVQRLADQFAHHGYRLMLSITAGMEDQQRNGILELLDQRASGVIVCTSHPGLVPHVQRIVRNRVPMVMIGPMNRGPSVGCDQHKGGFLAGRHLIDIGRRRLVYFTERSEKPGEESKAEGFIQATRRQAQWMRPLDRSRLPDILTPHSLWSAPVAEELLRQFPDVDGIFTGSDAIAIPLVARLCDLGRRVPEKIAVVGFDDLPQARWAAVPLTTIRQPIDQYARLAANMLMDQLRRPPRTNIPPHRLPCELVVRRSTDPSWIFPSETGGAS
jgi:LacI family transcriptional regulator